MGTERKLNSVEDKAQNEKLAEADTDHCHNFRKVASLQLVCGSTVVLGLWIVPRLIGINVVEHPVETLRIFLALALPVLLIAFSQLQLHPTTGPMQAWWAIIRGLMSLPVGVLAATFVALIFGAPLPLEYATRTLHWAALMSAIVVVPGATVLGASWSSWVRIFAYTKPFGPVEIAICIPAHGAAIGAWMGAWPMPLDWERPWQEWPVCCTYGAVGGYLVSLLGSLMWSYFESKCKHKKLE